MTAKTSALFSTIRKLIIAGPVLTKEQCQKDIDRFPTITALLNTLQISQQQLWSLIVASIYMRPAPDGNTYTEEHGECSLLLNAKFHLNNQGLMELEIRETLAYKEYYAKGKDDHLKLMAELTRACEWLHLYFLPNQKIHEKNVVFTPESSAILMLYGFQYTRKNCLLLIKELLAARHLAFYLRPWNFEHHLKTIIVSKVFPTLDYSNVVEVASAAKIHSPGRST